MCVYLLPLLHNVFSPLKMPILLVPSWETAAELPMEDLPVMEAKSAYLAVVVLWPLLDLMLSALLDIEDPGSMVTRLTIGLVLGNIR